jgi:hypothetical protein
LANVKIASVNTATGVIFQNDLVFPITSTLQYPDYNSISHNASAGGIFGDWLSSNGEQTGRNMD